MTQVSELERQMQHVLPSKVDDVAYGVSLVHEDAKAIRETVTGHDGRFDAIDQRFDAIDQSLAEILRRLPAAE
jgi:hypothetical protein